MLRRAAAAPACTTLTCIVAVEVQILKDLAYMGFRHIDVVDLDTIDLTNLNRQFLFRSHNVGKQKSEASAAAARVMNPSLNVKPHTRLVMTSTEDYFNDTFWESLNFVTNALDNIKARECVHV